MDWIVVAIKYYLSALSNVIVISSAIYSYHMDGEATLPGIDTGGYLGWIIALLRNLFIVSLPFLAYDGVKSLTGWAKRRRAPGYLPPRVLLRFTPQQLAVWFALTPQKKENWKALRPRDKAQVLSGDTEPLEKPSLGGSGRRQESRP